MRSPKPQRLSQRSLPTRSAIFGAVMLLATAVSFPVGYAIFPTKMSLLADLAAGGICFLAGCIAMGVSELFRRPQHVVALVAVGAITRLGLVLAAAVAIYLQGGPLVSAGVLYYLIGFYQVSLTVEIVLILPGGRPSDKPLSEQGDHIG